MADVAYKASNSSDQEHLEYPVSPTQPASIPPFPCCRPSILMEGHTQTEEQTHGAGKDSTKVGRCAYILCAVTCTECLVLTDKM